MYSDRELGFESLIDSIVAHEVDAAPVLIAKFQKCNSVYEVGIETSVSERCKSGPYELSLGRMLHVNLITDLSFC
jgi:hypothetical protein